MDELGRLGRPGAYRLGELRAAGAEPDRPRPYRPKFVRSSRRGPVSAWVLAFTAGVAAVASGVVAGLFVAPFLVGLLAGLVMRFGGWRPRAVLTAATVMGAAGCGIPLAWQALQTGQRDTPGRVAAEGLRAAGLSAHGTRGVAVGLLAGTAAALVAAGLGGVLAGRALARYRARVGDIGEPSRPADAGDLVRLLGAPAAPAGRVSPGALVIAPGASDHGGMADRALTRRAEAAGIAPSYADWRGRRVEVGDETLTAILAALDSVPAGTAQAAGSGPAPDDVHPGPVGAGARAMAPAPGGRSWGFTVQLYSVRSRRSWGHGDLRDLADLARWSARDLGAGFVLINPLHAAEPLPPVSPSPYLPMTRRYVSPLYLRIEDIAEYHRLDARHRDRVDALAAPLRSRNATADLIDRDAVWTAKREALKIIRRVPLSDLRREEYQQFRRREGRALGDWSAWCALAERYGPDWRSWPGPARDPRHAADIMAPGGPSPDPGRETPQADPEFHAWLQWLADEQLAAAQRAAQEAGMEIGIIGDLAVGAHPGGADAWANQDLLVRGLSVGAPPDEFNQRGQDWSQPPWHPWRLAAAGYRPLADLFAAALRHGGGLRVDHVMGLMRLWVVPEGTSPDHGAYISYDHQAAVAALAGQAARAGALAIGEDLGTIDPWISRYLADSGILGTSMLWFARGPDGTPLAPERWRRNCMATVGTHDMPPAAAFRTGEQVTLRARLGLLQVPEESERSSASLALSRWRDALVREGLIPDGPLPGPGEFTVALYGYLALTSSALIGVSLADAVGERRPQNIPGTTDQYPNWRIPLCDGAGRAVLLEDLPGLPLVRAVADATRTRRPGGGSAGRGPRRRDPR